jgi:dipeptidyl aminopeptidase/acylaminoacyl peptidase
VQSLKFKFKKRPARFYLLAILLLLILAGTATFYLYRGYHAQQVSKGVLADDEQFPLQSQDAYKNLDLKIAAKYHYDGGQIQKIRELGTANGVSISVISFKVPADNLTEYGLMTQPIAAKPAGGYPVLILCHGYATPSVYSTYNFYLGDMEEYSRAGFVVIKPDFRGQGLSLHSGTPDGAYYSMAYNTDLMSLIAGIKKTKYLDGSNLSLWGHSMGAYIALRAAVIDPEIKKVVLLSGPVGDIRDMYQSYVPISDFYNPVANSVKQSVLLRYGSPLTNRKFWDQTSPLSNADLIKAYVQIHVGSLDQTVPPRFSADLDKTLSAIHKPHGYFVYPQGNHGLYSERVQIYSRSLEILKPKHSNT